MPLKGRDSCPALVRACQTGCCAQIAARDPQGSAAAQHVLEAAKLPLSAFQTPLELSSHPSTKLRVCLMCATSRAALAHSYFVAAVADKHLRTSSEVGRRIRRQCACACMTCSITVCCFSVCGHARQACVMAPAASTGDAHRLPESIKVAAT